MAEISFPKEINRAKKFGNLTANVANLTELKLVPMAKQTLGDGGAFSFTGKTVTLTPEMPIFVRQRRVRLTGIEKYINEHSEGNEIAPARVYYRDGQYWHLDGLHRIVTARILGKSLEATIWG